MTDKISEDFKKILLSKSSFWLPRDWRRCIELCGILASDMANYINGETIHVNGGMYMA